MFNSDTELLFPMRVIPSLGDIRGSEWQKLISALADGDSVVEDRIAFSMMIVKLAGCSSCNADSFRAMRGCTQCSRTILKRFKGSDSDLVSHFSDCQKEVQAYLLKREA